MPRDDWIAISVTSDSEWRALCAVIGAEELAADRELDDVGGRMRRHDQIDQAIAAWARRLPSAEAVGALVAAGVPAAPFIGQAGLSRIPEIEARGLYEEVDQPGLGRVPIVGYPARFEHGPARVHRSPSPTLGQHNREILERLLKLSSAEVDELEATGVIGYRPKAAAAW
jgi:crotonobetainyl-CoA:carnitine CoA-transferase CaiB-like acyl-CoA transferase